VGVGGDTNNLSISPSSLLSSLSLLFRLRELNETIVDDDVEEDECGDRGDDGVV